MPFTLLKLEKSSEYQHQRDRYETRRANRREWALAALSMSLFLMIAIYVGIEALSGVLIKALIVGIVTVILTLIGYGFRSIGAKLEVFGGWLVNKTKR